jgi:thioredoxin 1
MIEITKQNFKTEVLDFPGKVLVDFWAPWCGPCQMLGPVMEEIATENEGKVKVVKLNVDDNQDISAEYNVSAIPTVILFDNGQIKETFIGFKQKQDYLTAVNK